MLIILVVLSIIFALSSIFLFTKNIVNYNNLKFYKSENEFLSNKISHLEEEKIELIKNIENFRTKLEHEKIAREDALNSSKAAMEKMNHEMLQRLLEVHKKETEESRKMSENNIHKKTEEFNKELSKLQESFVKIYKDISDSKNTVDKIQTALLSPISSGQLAELTLENILKNSGLKSGIDYQMQYSFTSNEDNKMRPDAVVFLPEDEILVIDAKSSQFLLKNDDEKQLLKSVQSHLKSLSSKEYSNEISKKFNDRKINIKRVVTIMFIPSEQAVQRITELEKDLMNKFWEAQIYPAGPIGLMNILNLSKIHISHQMKLQNMEDIITEISSLLSSISILSDYGSKIGNSISQLVSNYDKFAGSFNRNFLSKAKKIENFGVNQGKKTNQMLKRYDLIPSKSEMIDLEDDEYESDLKASFKNENNEKIRISEKVE